MNCKYAQIAGVVLAAASWCGGQATVEYGLVHANTGSATTQAAATIHRATQKAFSRAEAALTNASPQQPVRPAAPSRRSVKRAAAAKPAGAPLPGNAGSSPTAPLIAGRTQITILGQTPQGSKRTRVPAQSAERVITLK